MISLTRRDYDMLYPIAEAYFQRKTSYLGMVAESTGIIGKRAIVEAFFMIDEDTMDMYPRSAEEIYGGYEKTKDAKVRVETSHKVSSEVKKVEKETSEVVEQQEKTNPEKVAEEKEEAKGFLSELFANIAKPFSWTYRFIKQMFRGPKKDEEEVKAAIKIFDFFGKPWKLAWKKVVEENKDAGIIKKVFGTLKTVVTSEGKAGPIITLVLCVSILLLMIFRKTRNYVVKFLKVVAKTLTLPFRYTWKGVIWVLAKVGIVKTQEAAPVEGGTEIQVA